MASVSTRSSTSRLVANKRFPSGRTYSGSGSRSMVSAPVFKAAYHWMAKGSSVMSSLILSKSEALAKRRGCCFRNVLNSDLVVSESDKAFLTSGSSCTRDRSSNQMVPLPWELNRWISIPIISSGKVKVTDIRAQSVRSSPTSDGWIMKLSPETS